jgi:hypothetical protein
VIVINILPILWRRKLRPVHVELRFDPRYAGYGTYILSILKYCLPWNSFKWKRGDD